MTKRPAAADSLLRMQRRVIAIRHSGLQLRSSEAERLRVLACDRCHLEPIRRAHSQNKHSISVRIIIRETLSIALTLSSAASAGEALASAHAGCASAYEDRRSGPAVSAADSICLPATRQSGRHCSVQRRSGDLELVGLLASRRASEPASSAASRRMSAPLRSAFRHCVLLVRQKAATGRSGRSNIAVEALVVPEEAITALSAADKVWSHYSAHTTYLAF